MTRADRLRQIAADIGSTYPAHADFLLALAKHGNAKRDKWGYTPHDFAKARLHRELKSKIARKCEANPALEADDVTSIVLRAAAREHRISTTTARNVLKLDGSNHKNARAILRRWGDGHFTHPSTTSYEPNQADHCNEGD